MLTLAVAAGIVLALWHVRAADGSFSRPPLAIGVVHGVVGAVGLAVLLLALRGPPAGVAAGAGAFGGISAALLGCALLSGIAMLSLRRNAVVMAIHAGLAITGFVLLLAWNSVG